MKILKSIGGFLGNHVVPTAAITTAVIVGTVTLTLANTSKNTNDNDNQVVAESSIEETTTELVTTTEIETTTETETTTAETTVAETTTAKVEVETTVPETMPIESESWGGCDKTYWDNCVFDFTSNDKTVFNCLSSSTDSTFIIMNLPNDFISDNMSFIKSSNNIDITFVECVNSNGIMYKTTSNTTGTYTITFPNEEYEPFVLTINVQ